MNVRLVVLAVSLCFSQCSKQEIKPTPTELTVKFVNELRPQFVGTWQIRQAQINYEELVSVYYSTGIRKDTLLQDLAVLSFRASSEKPSDGRVLELEGTLQFRAKEYPIYAKLYPTQNSTKRKGTLFMDYNFKGGNIDIASPEVDYLKSIGLIGDNLTVETTPDGSAMIWRGLSRAIVVANLYKRQ